MLILYIVLVVLAVLILAALILIQNNKGGGLSTELTGLNNQILGVQRTSDILEKGTWLFAVILLVLCLSAPWFIPDDKTSKEKSLSKEENFLNNMNLKSQPAQDAGTLKLPVETKKEAPKTTPAETEKKPAEDKK